jgi:hypothetical protein
MMSSPTKKTRTVLSLTTIENLFIYEKPAMPIDTEPAPFLFSKVRLLFNEQRRTSPRYRVTGTC